MSGSLTLHHVLQQDTDVLVAVGARLLVVEAQGVQQLVLDGALEDTPLAADGHRLALPPAPHEGEAPVRKEEVVVAVRYHRGVDRRSDCCHIQLSEHYHPCMEPGGYPERDSMSTKSRWPFKGTKRMQVEVAKDARPCMMVFRSLAAGWETFQGKYSIACTLVITLYAMD